MSGCQRKGSGARDRLPARARAPRSATMPWPFDFQGREIRGRRGETSGGGAHGRRRTGAAGNEGGRAARPLLRHGRLPGMPRRDRRPRQSARLHDQARPAAARCGANPISRPAADLPPATEQPIADEEVLTPDVLVLGGGAGGLNAAATAARAGARVLLVDERPQPGGQYYKQPLDIAGRAALADDAQFAGGRALIAEARGRRRRLPRGRAAVGRVRAARSHDLRRPGEPSLPAAAADRGGRRL